MKEYQRITIDQIFDEHIAPGAFEIQGIPFDIEKFDEGLEDFAKQKFTSDHHNLPSFLMSNGGMMYQLPSAAQILKGKLRSPTSKNMLIFEITIEADETGDLVGLAKRYYNLIDRAYVLQEPMDVRGKVDNSLQTYLNPERKGYDLLQLLEDMPEEEKLINPIISAKGIRYDGHILGNAYIEPMIDGKKVISLQEARHKKTGYWHPLKN